MFSINVYQGRTIDFDVQIYENDGTTAVSLASDDVVRVKVGKGEAEPDLDMSSIEAETGGSSVTFTPNTNDVTVRFGTDTNDIEDGIYDMEVAVVDASETAPPDAIKHAEYGVMTLHPTMAGELGDEESSSSSSTS
jgi:hypothetical protein